MSNDAITAGVDIGSTTSKSLVMMNGNILAYVIGPSSANPARTASEVFMESCARAGIKKDDVSYIIGTGYGRARVTFADDNVSEISCHAVGAYSIMPGVRTIIDIGGQDCKAISLDDGGKLKNFAMNDKCAAGTGRFLDVMSRVLEVEVSNLGTLDFESNHPASISNVCSVFAESEVINLINEGASVPDIIKGLHNSLTNRVSVLVNKVGLHPDMAVTGGVAKNKGVIRALSEKLGSEIKSLDAMIDQQIIGALGAAIIAKRKLQKDLVAVKTI
jgi:predicted CoA-substrate-specific enzyme activase